MARKRRLRLVGAVAAVVVVAAAAVTGWQVFGKDSNEEPSAPAAAAASDSGDNPNDLSDAEIDLLKLSDYRPLQPGVV